VERVTHLAPALHGGEDAVGGFAPDERLGLVICFGDEAVDGSLQFDDRSEDSAFEPLPGELGEQTSTALAQKQKVGVKWKVKR
jgi:hypothetical protein